MVHVETAEVRIALQIFAAVFLVFIAFHLNPHMEAWSKGMRFSNGTYGKRNPG